MMRSLLFIVTPVALLAQSSTATYQRDVNGRMDPVGTRDQSNGDRTERTRSVDGRTVPVDSSSEKVLRKDSSGSLIERTVQRYDSNGRPAGQEKVVVEEKILPGGGKIVTETASRSDLSGRFTPTQRTTTETQVSGGQTTTSTTLDRPGVNGGFVTQEKRNAVTTGPKGREQTTETVDRADISGRFRTVERNETSSQTSGGQSSENKSSYALDATGKMVLRDQKVTTTTTRPGGGSTTETTVYRANVGASVSSSGKMLPAEQEIIDRAVGSDGRVRETTSVRRASAADPGKLEAARQVSETMCTGKCLPPTATAPAGTTAPAAAPAAKGDAKAPAVSTPPGNLKK
jgi:hypothetical protein